jgi:methionine-rich copper-binding protein CopC
MKIKPLLVVGVLAIASAATSTAYAHAKLEASEPKADSVATAAPKEVRLQFNETLELPFRKIKLLDEKNVAIEPSAIRLDKANPKAMIATLPPLPAGAYRVQWTTMTRDGHKVKGEFGFKVK